MTKPFIAYLLMPAMIIALASCGTINQVSTARRTACANSLEDSSSCFVIKIDGSVENFESLKLVTSVYKTPHLLTSNGTRIYAKEISAYQTNDHFALFAGSFSIDGHKSNVAVEALPGFAVRIKKGRLNAYVKKYKGYQRVVDEFYFQLGNGQVHPYTPELMDALIKNMPEALAFYNDYKKQLEGSSELKATARIYNDAYFNSTASNTKKRKRVFSPR